jgi:hypothetical protein
VQQRLDYKTASPEAFKAMIYTEQQVHKSGLEESLLELVKIRASQINGWNRLNVAFRTKVGDYVSPHAATLTI